jgi:hypothetical protein
MSGKKRMNNTFITTDYTDFHNESNITEEFKRDVRKVKDKKIQDRIKKMVKKIKDNK